ncbi:MAG: hypothetical protein NTV14_04870 [Coprothermobacterota bacterium]|nr:hypothetical protein [Coprothermobacterota bacterium]
MIDIYKLCYQGILGPEHLTQQAGPSTRSSPRALLWEESRARLEEEWEGLPPMNPSGWCGDSLWEAARPDGRLGRLHLGAWRARGGSWQAIAEAFLDTAQAIWGSLDELGEVWEEVETACREGLFHYPLAEVERLHQTLVIHRYPSVHHSASYRRAYHPAYRLISRSALRSLLSDPSTTGLSSSACP